MTNPTLPTIPCLDHGYVSYMGHFGSDEFIVDTARQSTGGGFVSWEPYEGHPTGDGALLDYMMRHRHTGPFEFGVLCVEVVAPIFVFRQWQRHRTFSYEEASARYKELPALFYIPADGDRGWTGGDSYHTKDGCFVTVADRDDRIARGIPRELARIDMPQNQYSRMRAIGNLHNWLHFLELRSAPNAQKEIRVYAEAVADYVHKLWPRTYGAWTQHRKNAKTFSADEMSIIRVLIGTDDMDLATTAARFIKGRRLEEFLAKLGLSPEPKSKQEE